MCKPGQTRTCRWHECRATFTIDRPQQRGKLYCSPACREAMKKWGRKHGPKALEILMGWHATRHAKEAPKIFDPVSGKDLTALQIESRYGLADPRLVEGEIASLRTLGAFARQLRDEHGI